MGSFGYFALAVVLGSSIFILDYSSFGLGGAEFLALIFSVMLVFKGIKEFLGEQTMGVLKNKGANAAFDYGMSSGWGVPRAQRGIGGAFGRIGRLFGRRRSPVGSSTTNIESFIKDPIPTSYVDPYNVGNYDGLIAKPSTGGSYKFLNESDQASFIKRITFRGRGNKSKKRRQVNKNNKTHKHNKNNKSKVK